MEIDFFIYKRSQWLNVSPTDAAALTTLAPTVSRLSRLLVNIRSILVKHCVINNFMYNAYRWKLSLPLPKEARQGSPLWWLWWGPRWCKLHERDRDAENSTFLMYRSRLFVLVNLLLSPRLRKPSAVPMVDPVVLTVLETVLFVLSWLKNKRLSRRSSRVNKFLLIFD